MRKLTPSQLVKYVKDYDYEITREQAVEIMELLEEQSINGSFDSNDIEMVTNYVVLGKDSVFYNDFN